MLITSSNELSEVELNKSQVDIIGFVSKFSPTHFKANVYT